MRALLLLAALSSGCVLRSAGPAAPPVLVSELRLDFPVRERGELAFALRLPPGVGKVASVSWQLTLEGVRFAAGLEGAPTQEGSAVRVESVLASQHLVWREGEGWLDVVLEGEVDPGDGAPRLRFRDRRELRVHGRPQLNNRLD